METQDGGEDRQPRRQHYAHPNRQAQRQRVELVLQLAPKHVEVIARGDFGHDELPRRLGVSLGLVLRYASIAKLPGIAQTIERERHYDRALYGAAQFIVPRSAVEPRCPQRVRVKIG